MPQMKTVKALRGFGGRGVVEIIEVQDGDTYRAVYTVKFATAIYVLHAFQKKSKSGIATPKHEIDLIAARPKDAEALHRHFALEKNNMTKLPKFTDSSGNVFADLGLENADELLLKAQIVGEIARLMKVKKLTQVKAATLTGTTQPDLSNLLRGKFRGFSIERLLLMLTAFGRDVDLVVRPAPKSRAGGIRFKPLAA
jgi:predicted XRE-type DNA-binding protein